jgi:hypothetical protein
VALSFRQRWRIANKLQDILGPELTAAAVAARTAVLADEYGPLKPLAVTIGKARARYDAAAALVAAGCIDAQRLVPLATTGLNRVQTVVAQSTLAPLPELPALPALPIGELLAELEQLEAEFDDCGWDHAAKYLYVTTEALVLESRESGEEVDFGPFKLCLSLAELARSPSPDSCIRALPLRPRPLPEHPAITHPHVRANVICTGDGYERIRDLIAQGRLADAFMLLDAVLHNVGSPHAHVGAWLEEEEETDTVSCAECGCDTYEDSRSYCERCNHDVCDDCYRGCSCCEEARCTNCTQACPGCDELVCGRCRRGRGHDYCDACHAHCTVCDTDFDVQDVALTRGDARYCADCTAPCGGCAHTFPSTELNDDALCAACATLAAEEETTDAPAEPVSATFAAACQAVGVEPPAAYPPAAAAAVTSHGYDIPYGDDDEDGDGDD